MAGKHTLIFVGLTPPTTGGAKGQTKASWNTSTHTFWMRCGSTMKDSPLIAHLGSEEEYDFQISNKSLSCSCHSSLLLIRSEGGSRNMIGVTYDNLNLCRLARIRTPIWWSQQLTRTVADVARGFLLGDFGLSAVDSLRSGVRLMGAELGRVGRLF